MFRRYAMLLSGVLAACAPVTQQPESTPQSTARPAVEAVPDGLLADQIRLFRVSYPLLRASREFCREGATYGMGLFALNRYSLGPLANVAWRYGIGDELKVLAAAPDGPAYRAGLNAGDIIVSINGHPGPTTAAATRIFGIRMAQLARAGTPLAVVATRGGQTVNARVPLELLCGYQVQVAEVPQVNARADGRRAVQITRGMMRFARTDPELAIVVAHEIAHNAMGHREAKTQLARSLAATGTPAVGTASGVTPAFSQALEMEADHLGLYLVARAGFSIDEAPAFIERLSAASRAAALESQTHPAGAARVAAMKRTIVEIEGKRAAGSPLVP